MNNTKQTITVIGCGYVGLTTAVILANSGYKVYALEIDPDRLAMIKTGQSFFYEAGIDPLLSNALGNGGLIATDSYNESLPASDIVFSCVGTPDNPDGSSNLEFINEAAKQAGQHMRPSTIFAQKSTVPVGTGERLAKDFSARGITYVSNPEFLREGSAIADTLWFDRAVAGSSNKAAAQQILDLYKGLEKSREQLASIAGIDKSQKVTTAQYYLTTLASAELIKVTANAFLALKISFANSIAKLADQTNADVVEVLDAVGADKRIGQAFLNAGRGYGGGCFPKDVSGLIRSAEDNGVNLELMQVAAEVNDSMPHYIINKALKLAGGSFKDKRIAILGLAFKAGTSDARRSPAIAIANSLAQQGAQVIAYDPQAMDEAKPRLDKEVMLAESTSRALKNADCVFIATEWPEFTKIREFDSRTTLLVDCMNCFDSSGLPSSIQYIAVGL